MKIIYGITKSNFGGAQRYVFDLAKASKKCGHDVAVLCGGNGVLVEELHRENIRTIRLEKMQRDVSLFEELWSFFKILKILRIEKPDVFHINSSKMGGVGSVAGRLIGVEQVVFTAHGLVFEEDRSSIVKFIIKVFSWITFLFAKEIVTISKEDFIKVRKMPLISLGKVHLIHNGIHVPEFLEKTLARKHLSQLTSVKIPDNIIWLGTISELTKNKGLEYAIESLALLSHKNWVFFIISPGEELEKLRKLVSEKELERNVFFLGFVQDANKYLKAFDIFTLTSVKEGHPYVLLEASEAKIAVVGSDLPGIRDIIIDGESGLITKIKDPKDIKDKIEILIRDKNLRDRLGKNLQENTRNNFSLNKMMEDTFYLYSWPLGVSLHT